MRGRVCLPGKGVSMKDENMQISDSQAGWSQTECNTSWYFPQWDRIQMPRSYLVHNYQRLPGTVVSQLDLHRICIDDCLPCCRAAGYEHIACKSLPRVSASPISTYACTIFRRVSTSNFEHSPTRVWSRRFLIFWFLVFNRFRRFDRAAMPAIPRISFAIILWSNVMKQPMIAATLRESLPFKDSLQQL